jgi:hypothetical protein
MVEVYRRFRGTCCLHHQGDKRPEDSHLHTRRLTTWNLTQYFIVSFYAFSSSDFHSECSMPSNFYVMQFRTITVTHSYLKTSVFTSYLFFLSSFLSFYLFLSSSFLIFLIPYLHFWTWLYSITMFLQTVYNQNQQLALSRLMHRIHCGSAVFPHQALERRTVQET